MSGEFLVTQEMIEANRVTKWKGDAFFIDGTVDGLISELKEYPPTAIVTMRMDYEGDSAVEVRWEEVETDDDVVERLYSDHRRYHRKQQEEIALLKSLQEKYKGKEL